MTLREVIREREAKSSGFKLRDASFKGGKGLTPDFAKASWMEILEASYERQDDS